VSVFAPLGGDVITCSSADGAFVGVMIKYLGRYSSRNKIEGI
jgi:hypothetical protein